jgi:hypothetical protein
MLKRLLLAVDGPASSKMTRTFGFNGRKAKTPASPA